MALYLFKSVMAVFLRNLEQDPLSTPWNTVIPGEGAVHWESDFTLLPVVATGTKNYSMFILCVRGYFATLS